MSYDPRLAPPDVYRTVRWSSSEYDCLMTGKSRPYLLRLHFSESSREKVAGEGVKPEYEVRASGAKALWGISDAVTACDTAILAV